MDPNWDVGDVFCNPKRNLNIQEKGAGRQFAARSATFNLAIPGKLGKSPGESPPEEKQGCYR